MKHPVTWTLIILNIIVFLLVFSMPESLQEQTFKAFYFSFGTSWEVWRWFTSLFLHASASHLFFNMLGLYFFGKNLEEESNRQWTLGIYFVAGLLGNLVFMLTSTSSVVGASGCVFGLLGAAMLLNPTKITHLYLFPLPMGLIAVLFIIVESLVAYIQPAAYANIATVAHLAGLVTGSIFAFFYRPKKAVEGFLILLLCLFLLIILGPVFALITGIAGFILSILDSVIGFFLYGLAGLLSFIWG